MQAVQTLFQLLMTANFYFAQNGHKKRICQPSIILTSFSHFKLANLTVLEVSFFAQDIGELFSSLTFLTPVRGYGIIGGGAVLFFGSSVVGSTILPALGETFLVHTWFLCTMPLQCVHIKLPGTSLCLIWPRVQLLFVLKCRLNYKSVFIV